MAVKRAITEHALLTAIAAVAAESGRGSLPPRDMVREHRAVQLAREHHSARERGAAHSLAGSMVEAGLG